MESLARENFMQAVSQKASFDAHDARVDRNKTLATALVMEYMVNVATLYSLPMCELLERLKVKVLSEYGNG